MIILSFEKNLDMKERGKRGGRERERERVEER